MSLGGAERKGDIEDAYCLLTIARENLYKRLAVQDGGSVGPYTTVRF